MSGNDCIFCKISTGEVPTDFLYLDRQIMVIRDIRAQRSHPPADNSAPLRQGPHLRRRAHLRQSLGRCLS